MLQQLIHRLDLQDEDAIGIAEQSQIAGIHGVPRQDRNAPQLRYRQVCMVIGMECNRGDAIAAFALMAIQGLPDTFEDAAHTRNRARRHGTRLAPTLDALARRKRCEPHGLNSAGAPLVPRGSPWRHAAADGGRRACRQALPSASIAAAVARNESAP